MLSNCETIFKKMNHGNMSRLRLNLKIKSKAFIRNKIFF